MSRSRGDFQRWATRLFDQQLWCWGRDIARPRGNVLLEKGMCRYRSALPGASTLYKASLDADCELWLWGFGLLVQEPTLGSIFLERSRFAPLLVSEALTQPVHRQQDLGPLTIPLGAARASAESLVRRAATWAAGYEHWVAESLGIDYRQAVLKARDMSAIVPASDMASSWERVAKKSFRLSGPQTSTGPWSKLLESLRFACDTPVASTEKPTPSWRQGRHRFR